MSARGFPVTRRRVPRLPVGPVCRVPVCRRRPSGESLRSLPSRSQSRLVTRRGQGQGQPEAGSLRLFKRPGPARRASRPRIPMLIHDYHHDRVKAGGTGSSLSAPAWTAWVGFESHCQPLGYPAPGGLQPLAMRHRPRRDGDDNGSGPLTCRQWARPWQPRIGFTVAAARGQQRRPLGGALRIGSQSPMRTRARLQLTSQSCQGHRRRGRGPPRRRTFDVRPGPAAPAAAWRRRRLSNDEPDRWREQAAAWCGAPAGPRSSRGGVHGARG